MGSPVVYLSCVQAPAAGSCAGRSSSAEQLLRRLASWRLLLSRFKRAAACRCSCSSRSSSCAAESSSLASFSCASTTHRGSSVQSAANSSSSSAFFGLAPVSRAISTRRCRARCRCHSTPQQITTAAAAPAALAAAPAADGMWRSAVAERAADERASGGHAARRLKRTNER